MLRFLASVQARAIIKRNMSEFYLSVCAIVRDEPDLPEWVAYQFAIGVEHVHIYDNESVTPVKKTLKEWIARDKVSVEAVNGRCRQRTAFASYLRKKSSRWVAFIDADEFIVPHTTDDLKTLLVEYESYGGLAVSWQVFGPDGHVTRPPGLVIESYTKKGNSSFDLTDRLSTRSPACWQYKTIVQLRYVRRCITPHYFAYKGKQCAVNEKAQVAPPRMLLRPSVEKLQINHYMSKSEEDWKLKQTRRGGQSGKARSPEEWHDLATRCNDITDIRIQRFASKVSDLLRLYSSGSLQRDVLYAGPWVGEFGWELCWWNPLIREISKHYKHVIVSAPERSRYLYEFADEFIGLQTKGMSCIKGKLRGFRPKIDHKWAVARPSALWKRYGRAELSAICTWQKVTTPKIWRRLSSESRYVADVLCAFRPPKITGYETPKIKDYSPVKCAKIVSQLIDSGFSVACYGGADNYYFPNTIDLRGLALETQSAALAGAKVAVGPSSAPLHLAALCECPHVTWSGVNRSVGFRYRGPWNPFQCEVDFLNKPSPPVEDIVAAIKKVVSTQHS